nr:Hypothetical protein [Raoultella ornithinolytica]UUW42116.1 hypothetical protein [Klebsiella michiganensis]UVN19573.1 hypothetical protein [Klebsiella michiganensis]
MCLAWFKAEEAMNKLILSLLLCVPLASGISAESDPDVRPPEKK